MGSAKERLIAAGMRMLLRHGYGNLGIQAVLDETKAPKGSFYHHFRDKEDFGLQVVDAYVTGVHAALDRCLADPARSPLERVRAFFDLVRESYRQEGYLGCLMGGLGQELSGVSDAFRRKIEWCFSSIADRIARCLEQARSDGSIPPATDPRALADLLVDCWEGAALRSRLRRSAEPLDAMLDFYLAAVRIEAAAPVSRPPASGGRSASGDIDSAASRIESAAPVSRQPASGGRSASGDIDSAASRIESAAPVSPPPASGGRSASGDIDSAASRIESAAPVSRAQASGGRSASGDIDSAASRIESAAPVSPPPASGGRSASGDINSAASRIESAAPVSRPPASGGRSASGDIDSAASRIESARPVSRPPASGGSSASGGRGRAGREGSRRDPP